MAHISIRHVPEPLRDALAARARTEGKSLQEYLLSALQGLAERPTKQDVLARVRAFRARHASDFRGVTADAILRAKDSPRR